MKLNVEFEKFILCDKLDAVSKSKLKNGIKLIAKYV